MDVTVAVTVEGESTDTIRAVQDGGGIVGIETSNELPAGVDFDFLDWPWMPVQRGLLSFEEAREQHIDVAANERPELAVAPDVVGDVDLDAALDVAADLDRFAETVIVVPKDVKPDRIPDQYRVGIPFRDEFQTDTGRNNLSDFAGVQDLHILGGNPNAHFALASDFRLDVASVDTPKILAWADFGRVFAADGGSGLEVNHMDGRLQAALGSRAERVEFSVRAMLQAWNEGRVTYRYEVEPGRGPPPVPSDPGLRGPAETERERAQMKRRFEEAKVEEVIGVVRSAGVSQTRLGDIPDEVLDEGTTAGEAVHRESPSDDFQAGLGRFGGDGE